MPVVVVLVIILHAVITDMSEFAGQEHASGVEVAGVEVAGVEVAGVIKAIVKIQFTSANDPPFCVVLVAKAIEEIKPDPPPPPPQVVDPPPPK